jgi:hypothetical protein
MIFDLKQNLNPPRASSHHDGSYRCHSSHTSLSRTIHHPNYGLTVERRVFYLQTLARQDRFLLIDLGPIVEVSRVHALTEEFEASEWLPETLLSSPSERLLIS